MKLLLAVSLMLFGLCWAFYATITLKAVTLRSMSDAMQLESDLHKWTMNKVEEGKLDQKDCEQLFTPEHKFVLGGENRNIHFREMITNIARAGIPPVWPGVIALLIGLSGIFHYIFEQDYKEQSELSKDIKPSTSPKSF